MTIFLRLLGERDKANSLAEGCAKVRLGFNELRCFEVPPEEFDAVPGKPFAYWVSNAVRQVFRRLPRFEGQDRSVRVGLQTGDDFRFVRTFWELNPSQTSHHWYPFAKGGTYSPFYADHYLVVSWRNSGAEMLSAPGSVLRNEDFYFKSGLTWADRTSSLLSVKPWPSGGIFSVKGSAGFFQEEQIYFVMGLMNSKVFNAFLEMMVNAGSAVSRSYQVGVIGAVPFHIHEAKAEEIGSRAHRAWSLKRSLDTVTETSHAFLLPLALRQAQAQRLGTFDPLAIEAELARIQAEIDDIAFDLYGFSDADRAAALGGTGGEASDGDAADDADAEGDEDEAADDTPSTDALLSWAIGVAFGRFDIRIATGERAAPPEPDPFDPLPAKSPGMLPDGDAPFHTHAGILVDDPGHAHDLVRIAERVLERVDMPVPAELGRWLQKDFFPFHLQRYSKSRRKAPIYWPLSTASGNYTLWLYYPSLTSQTLYTAINDFVEPKLAEVETEAATLRTKASARSRDEEKRLEALTTLEAELRDLRDQLQTIAPQYQPNHDDGVQITAAPLWPLFRHKPWQKVLKDTWAKLEKGDYDWAHLAMTYWPERVRDKCRHDKSLAIAHGLEELYVEPPAAQKKARGARGKG